MISFTYICYIGQLVSPPALPHLIGFEGANDVKEASDEAYIFDILKYLLLVRSLRQTTLTSSDSKARMTWKMPSTAWMCDKNAFPSPAPAKPPSV
jgi:hypothetical protein